MARSRDGSFRFTRPGSHIFYMLGFLILAAGVGAILYPTLQTAFEANPALNGVILGALILGVVIIFGQANVIAPSIKWIESYWDAADPSRTRLPRAPGLIAAVAAVLLESDKHGRISASASSAILDSVGTRIDENRELARYLIALLVFIGLLGTFWGLLETVNAVAQTISTLNNAGASSEAAIAQLIAGLEAPLGGMGTAFSSSLFGLAGSLVLGFLDLQSGQAQNRFYNDLEEWVSTMTALDFAAAPQGGAGSGYAGAVLERAAESFDRLETTLAKSEDSRADIDRDLHAAIGELRAEIAALNKSVASLTSKKD